MKKLNGLLTIRGLELQVNLGWRDKEMHDPQGVLLDIDVWFADEPKAVSTDHLSDTLDYAELINKIRAKISTKKYRLLERLCRDIYDVVKPFTPEKSRTIVKITKHPKIDGLKGGVSYSCYDGCGE